MLHVNSLMSQGARIVPASPTALNASTIAVRHATTLPAQCVTSRDLVCMAVLMGPGVSSARRDVAATALLVVEGRKNVQDARKDSMEGSAIRSAAAVRMGTVSRMGSVSVAVCVASRGQRVTSTSMCQVS